MELPTTILCATQLGASGQQVVDHAIVCAKTLALPLRLVHAIDLQPLAMSEIAPFSVQPAIEAMRAQLALRKSSALEALEAERSRCTAQSIACTADVVDGRAWQTVLDVAKSEASPVVVIGRHDGHSQIKSRSGTLLRRVLGSTAERVVRHSKSPVLVAGFRAEELARPMQRWVVGIDFSPASLAALKVAAHWAPKFDARLVVVHGTSIGDLSDEEITRYSTEAWYRPLVDWSNDQATERLARLLGEREIEAQSIHAVEDRHPSHALAEAVAEHHASLLVVGTHSESRLAERILGTTTERVLHACETSVLCVPA